MPVQAANVNWTARVWESGASTACMAFPAASVYSVSSCNSMGASPCAFDSCALKVSKVYDSSKAAAAAASVHCDICSVCGVVSF